MGTCTICLEDFTKDDKTVSLDGCNHEVHSHCFFEYANYEVKHHKSVGCPNCRHVVINVPELAPVIVVHQDNSSEHYKSLKAITGAFCVFIGVSVIIYLFK
jgi:hypothetical protein